MSRARSRIAWILCFVLCVASGAGWAQGGAPEKIIIDTDIGDDVDDAFALALAVKSPELQVLGVMTTFGDTEARAKIADRFLGEVGRAEIPVLADDDESSNITLEGYSAQEDEDPHIKGRDYNSILSKLGFQLRNHGELEAEGGARQSWQLFERKQGTPQIVS